VADESAALPLSPARERWARPLFFATIVTGSFLLFLTQPMIARMALPRLGGAPAVWNSAMLVYQALLLLGYFYAHRLARLAPRRQVGIHLALFAVAALWLPIGLQAWVPPTDFTPALWVPWFLIGSIGPLFFIVSAQAPLMQRWYALEPERGEPYVLYAASNLGSFAGLVSYPLLVEPLLTLEQQSLLWTGGYALLVALVAACALATPARAITTAVAQHSPAPPRSRVLHWIVLAAIPSGLMLSTTTHLTTDIVAVPLLWVVPLGLYLLSFVVAFADRRGPTEFITQIAPLIILIAGGLAFADGSQRPIFSATLGLSLLFVVAVTLHGEMYRLRPASDRLTGFYLAMSVGGLLGGAFCAIAAPLLFDWSYEHPLLILAAAALVPQRNFFPFVERIWARPDVRRILLLALPALVLLASLFGDRRAWPNLPEWGVIAAPVFIGLVAVFSIGRRSVLTVCLLALMLSYGGWSTLKQSWADIRTRSYFGIYTVSDRPGGTARVLMHGTTLHGVQSLKPGLQTEPTSYYTRESGVGIAMMAAPSLYGPNARVGVIGLGTGTLACYRLPGQSWTFFEIDPAMVRIASDPSRFSYLSRCAPEARIVLGDARLKVAELPPASLDLLVVDAFSSDAVPMHLLTREALRVYTRALRTRGLLMIHISNRYLNLEPILAAGAREERLNAKIMRYNPDVEATFLANAHPSVWVALTRDPAVMRRLNEGREEDVFLPMDDDPDFAGWTDDYATIIPFLNGLTD
jgi:hypothetical protein